MLPVIKFCRGRGFYESCNFHSVVAYSSSGKHFINTAGTLARSGLVPKTSLKSCAPYVKVLLGARFGKIQLGRLYEILFEFHSISGYDIKESYILEIWILIITIAKKE